MTRLRVLLGATLLGLAAAGGAWALRQRPVEVPVAREERDVPVRVFGLGTIEAQVSSRIGFEVAGTLAEVLADHGDRVPAGTVLAKHTLTAPFDAQVIARLREPGTALGPGEAVFSLVAPGSLWALAYVDEGRAGAIREGLPAEVRLRSLPGEVFPGRVVRIGLESDRVTEERRVHVRCERCPPQPILGEQVQVEVETGRLPAARLVPEAAVEGFDGSSGRVWVIEDGRLRQREVRFAARTLDARLALDPALPADLPVATRVLASFREGRAARPAP